MVNGIVTGDAGVAERDVALAVNGRVVTTDKTFHLTCIPRGSGAWPGR